MGVNWAKVKPGDIINGYRFMGTNAAAEHADQTKWAPLTGDEFLKTLAPADAAQVRALADGRMQFPGSFALRSPYWTTRLEQVSQYDPSFDAVNYGARAKTRGDFTAGKAAQNIRSLNTAIGHLGRLNDLIEGTAGHSGFPGATLVNAGVNAIEKSMGDPGVTNYEQAASALGSELTTTFRGGMGAEQDVTRWISQLDPNLSTEQKKEAVKNIADLLRSRVEALTDQYRVGMGRSSDLPPGLNPKALALFQKLSGQAGPTGQTPSVPQGIDPKLWQHMTPEERALWQ